MANLFETCKNIPSTLVRIQQANVIKERQQACYEKRMRNLDMEKHIFEECKGVRVRKRVRNRFSTDEAGTCGSGTYVRRSVKTVEIREPRGKKYGVMQYRTYSVKSYSSQTCKGSF